MKSMEVFLQNCITVLHYYYLINYRFWPHQSHPLEAGAIFIKKQSPAHFFCLLLSKVKSLDYRKFYPHCMFTGLYQKFSITCITFLSEFQNLLDQLFYFLCNSKLYFLENINSKYSSSISSLHCFKQFKIPFLTSSVNVEIGLILPENFPCSKSLLLYEKISPN
jgi:hypothetical protein